MGVFCACWVPFFVTNLLYGLCTALGETYFVLMCQQETIHPLTHSTACAAAFSTPMFCSESLRGSVTSTPA